MSVNRRSMLSTVNSQRGAGLITRTSAKQARAARLIPS